MCLENWPTRLTLHFPSILKFVLPRSFNCHSQQGKHLLIESKQTQSSLRAQLRRQWLQFYDRDCLAFLIRAARVSMPNSVRGQMTAMHIPKAEGSPSSKNSGR